MNRVSTPPASPAGIRDLGAILLELLGPRSVAVDDAPREVTDALLSGGMLAPAPGAHRLAAELIVSLGVVSGSSLDDCRGHVHRLTKAAAVAVVFSQADGRLRFPAWWDGLFAEDDFEPLDVLRTRLWDHGSWNAGALQSLTLYVRRTERPALGAFEAAGVIPRSAVHPGLFVPASREAAALHTLAATLEPAEPALGDPIAVIQQSLDDRSRDATAARDELRTYTDTAREVVRALRDEATRIREDLVVAERATHEAESALRNEQSARRRAEESSRAFREQPKFAGDASATRPSQSSIASTFALRAAGAVGRRIEIRALAAAGLLESLPGLAGRISKRSVALYRAVSTDWREATRALFDTDHYLAQRPGLVGAAIDPVVHYSGHGWRQGLDPHPLFDTDWYLRMYGTTICADVSPLEHFFASGWREGCDPHPLFDTDYYLRRSKDVAVDDVNPLVHFLGQGWHERRNPHPMFETGRYLDLYQDVRDSDTCPLVHYVTVGWREGRSPGVVFDAEWYLGRYPAAAVSGLPPYRYYLEVGVHCGDAPSKWAQLLHEKSHRSLGDRSVI